MNDAPSKGETRNANNQFDVLFIFASLHKLFHDELVRLHYGRMHFNFSFSPSLSSFVLSRVSCWLPLCRNAHAINVKLYNRKKAQQFSRAARLWQLFFVFPLKCWWELFKCMCASLTVEGSGNATPHHQIDCFAIYSIFMRFQRRLLNSSSLMATNNGRRVEFPISGAEKMAKAEVNCWNSKVKTDKSVRLKRMKCSGCDGVDNKLITRNSQTIDWMIFFRCTCNTLHGHEFVFIFIYPPPPPPQHHHRPNRVLIKKFQFFPQECCCSRIYVFSSKFLCNRTTMHTSAKL